MPLETCQVLRCQLFQRPLRESCAHHTDFHCHILLKNQQIGKSAESASQHDFGSRLALDFYPPLFPCAAFDGFTKENLFVAVGERRKVRWSGEITGADVTIHGLVELLEGIGKTLVVSAGVAGEIPRSGSEQ